MDKETQRDLGELVKEERRNARENLLNATYPDRVVFIPYNPLAMDHIVANSLVKQGLLKSSGQKYNGIDNYLLTPKGREIVEKERGQHPT